MDKKISTKNEPKVKEITIEQADEIITKDVVAKKGSEDLIKCDYLEYTLHR